MLRRKPLIAMPYALFSRATTSYMPAIEARDDYLLVFEERVEPGRSKFTFNNGKTFIMANEFAAKGGFAKVYHAFDLAKSTEPVSCVKVARDEESHPDLFHERSMLTMMGRNATLFNMDGNLALLTDWQSGNPLHKISKSEMIRLPLHARLQCLYSLLLQLKKLHDFGYCHKDLHSANIIADLVKYTMSMIDFGETGEMTSSLNAASDVICIGGHLKFIIFPDICNVEEAARGEYNDNHVVNGINEIITKMLRPIINNYSLDIALADCKLLLDAACQYEKEKNDTKTYHRMT